MIKKGVEYWGEEGKWDLTNEDEKNKAINFTLQNKYKKLETNFLKLKSSSSRSSSFLYIILLFNFV